jgi:hypothetical protein
MKNPPRPSPQPDGSSEPLNKTDAPNLPPVDSKPAQDPSPEPSPEEEHLGATEDQVSDTSAPAGEAYKDEPKQG